MSKLDKNNKEQQEVISHIQKSRGVKEEDKIINSHQEQTKKKVVKRNSVLYKLVIGNVITLMGRCDGIQEMKDGKQVIVEVKNRRKWFFYPVYEKVQIHAYMAMTGIHDCILVQNLHGVEKKDCHSFEKEFWNDIESKLVNYYEYFNKVCESEEEQDKLFPNKFVI